MKKFVVTLAIISFIGTSMTAVYAQSDSQIDKAHQGGYHHKHHKCMGMEKKLNLTKEQSAQAKALREQSRAKIKPLFAQLKTEKQKLRDLKKSNASQKDIQAQIEKIKQTRGQIKNIHKQNMAAFEQILTADQKVKFEKMKKEGRERMKNRMKNGQDHWKKFHSEDSSSQ